MISAMAEGFDPLKSDEDVEEILRLAVRSGDFGGADLRERLESSASELGISPEALAHAEEQWRAQKQTQVTLEQDKLDRKLFRKIRVGDFVSHLGSYLAVNGFLFWLDWRDGHVTWVQWPIMGWGIAIVIHAFSLLAHDRDNERDYQRWRKRRYKREEE